MAFILSLIGLVRGQDRAAAVVGLSISLLVVVLVFVLPLVALCVG